MTSARVLAVILAIGLFGCSSSRDDGDVVTGSSADTAATTATPELVFDGTWGYHGVGVRAPGVLADIVYDTSRLPKCRATTDGVAAWAISAFVSADGAAAKTYPLPTGKDGAAVEVPIEIPYGNDMAVWFEATDDSGCEEWDSSFGQNFHFTIAEPTQSVIHFAPDFTQSVQGALVAGQNIDIDYDFARLSQCRSSNGSAPAWQITMWYQLDGGTPVASDLAVAVDNEFRVPQAGHIALPSGTKTLTLWFENDDTYGCHQWDSAYGANYVFTIH